MSNCRERASPEIYPKFLLTPLFRPANGNDSGCPDNWTPVKFLPQMSRDISFFFLLPEETLCLGGSGPGWTLDSGPKWWSKGCTLLTGFLWLLVTDFFVHWQSGFLCSRLCVTSGAWYQPRLGTATPATAALLAHLPPSLLSHVCLLPSAKLVHFELLHQKFLGRGA